MLIRALMLACSSAPASAYQTTRTAPSDAETDPRRTFSHSSTKHSHRSPPHLAPCLVRNRTVELIDAWDDVSRCR